jgi:FkbM family methyltransferase
VIKDLVFDIGANNGDDTDYYLRRGFRVVAVEAVPEYAREVEARFSGAVEAGKLTVLPIAIGEQDGSTEFFVSEGNRGVWSSFDAEGAGKTGLATRKITVPTRSIRSLFAEYGVPYYLKVDIEGFDHLCLLGIDPADRPQYLSFEAATDRLCDLFTAYDKGYRKFKLIDQGAGFRKVVPPQLHSIPLAKTILSSAARRSLKSFPGLRQGVGLLRRSLARPTNGATAGSSASFNMSSSGPMAEDTNGTWESVDSTAYAWMYALSNPRLSHWYDVHATF